MTQPFLVDIAEGNARQPAHLAWGGMQAIDLPLQAAARPMAAKADAGGSLCAHDAVVRSEWNWQEA
ncbi:hypothetical protein ACGTN6_11970 [Halomonas sp. THAF12]|uniref:hypothetical protein n=1 Tax=Halomonas sp. B23F22_10 TaxID=3459515 RepID=UPI00373EB2B4